MRPEAFCDSANTAKRRFHGGARLRTPVEELATLRKTPLSAV